MTYDLETAGGLGIAMAIVGGLAGCAVAAGWFVYVWAVGFALPIVAAALSLCCGSVVFGIGLVAITLLVEVVLGDDKKGGVG